jgi:hypothetical protein
MTFEFDYNDDTDRITITYDGSHVLTADFDGEKVSFKNFDRVEDEGVEMMLKTLCRSAYNVLA